MWNDLPVREVVLDSHWVSSCFPTSLYRLIDQKHWNIDCKKPMKKEIQGQPKSSNGECFASCAHFWEVSINLWECNYDWFLKCVKKTYPDWLGLWMSVNSEAAAACSFRTALALSSRPARWRLSLRYSVLLTSTYEKSPRHLQYPRHV